MGIRDIYARVVSELFQPTQDWVSYLRQKSDHSLAIWLMIASAFPSVWRTAEHTTTGNLFGTGVVIFFSGVWCFWMWRHAKNVKRVTGLAPGYYTDKPVIFLIILSISVSLRWYAVVGLDAPMTWTGLMADLLFFTSLLSSAVWLRDPPPRKINQTVFGLEPQAT